MENFCIDDQTFSDLNIFSENPHSIYNLFKGTRTLAARAKLKDMMQHPSHNVNELILRRDAIRYFYQTAPDLNIRNEELDLIEFYLKSDKRKSKANIIDSVSDYFTRNSSNDYYIIKTGLKYLIKLTRYLKNFIEVHSTDATPEFLLTLFGKIKVIIESGQLHNSLEIKEKNLKFFEVNKLDHAFRGAEIENINSLLQLVYELDIYENLSMVALKLGLSFPEYDENENMRVNITGLFHPAIKTPVKNDVSFDKDQNIIFLTGSNMAGKSSLLKSIGLVIYLAHLGFPVPASEMHTTIFNGLITTINLPDNISQGLSHYYNEVKRVKEVALKLSESNRLFIIFDELFRGTNVKDAFDASLLIISELSKIEQSAFFISTHIVELADDIKKFSNISFRYLETSFKENKPIFTYLLTNGVSQERIGMTIVLNEGIIDILKKATDKGNTPNTSITLETE